MPIDMPPQIHERIVCSIAAAVHYDGFATLTEPMT
jgi:hypothetical protein